MMQLIGSLFSRASVVALFRGILVVIAMLLVARSDPSVAQTTVEPGRNFIAAGNHHSLALTCDGHVYAWGGNWNGQLGINSNNDHQVPYPVHGVDNEGYLSDITDVGAGFYRSLALKSDGTVYAWGENSDGQLGVGHTTLNLPLEVPGQVYANWDHSSYLQGVKAVDDGGQHSLALRNDGTVWAWGDDYHCQLAHWDECGSSTSYAVKVSGLPAGVRAVDVVGGGYHSLALMSDGTVYAWGEGRQGQLGVHSDNDHNSAVQVHGPDNVGYLTGITKVAAGLRHSLAVKDDGSLWAWGEGGHGQLGIHSDNDHTIPYQVHGPDNVGYLTDVVDVAAGDHHTLALKSDGTVYAWGEGGHGQLGIHSDNDHTIPYQVHGPDNVGYLTGIIEVAAGANFSLALRNDGTVWAWGENYYGQLGINSNNDHTIPYQVHGPDNVGYLTGIGPTCGTPPPGAGAPGGHILDQSQTETTGYGEVGAGEPRLGQVFTAGLYGILDQVRLELASSTRSPATGPVHVIIQTLTDDGLPSGVEIGRGTIPLSAIPPAGAPTWLDVSISPAKVIAGTQYALLLSTDGGMVNWYMNTTSEPDLYPDGHLVHMPLDTWVANTSAFDAGFETYVWPSTIDQSQTASNRNNLFGDWGRLGQTFTTGLYGMLGQVSVELENYSDAPATGPVDVSIQTLTDRGLPSGIEIGSGMIPFSAIPPAGSRAWVDVGVSDAYVTPGTRYVLLLSLSGGGNVRWADNNNGASYPGGSEVIGYPLGGWSTMSSYDTAFETSVMPSTLDQWVADQGFTWAFGDYVLAQTFTAGRSGILDRVGLCLANGSYPYQPAVDAVHVSIQTVTNAGLPSWTEIGSGTIPLDAIPPAGHCSWVDAGISGAYLTAGARYAIVPSTSWPGTAKWDGGLTNDYPGGESFGFDGNRWNGANGFDLSFKTYVIPAPAVALPATPPPSPGNSPTWRDSVLDELLRRSNPSPR